MTVHGAFLEDGKQKGDTLRCPHCGGHFLYLADQSFRTGASAMGTAAAPRINCRKCGRLTCGRACCDPATAGCAPIEARLEHIEGARNTTTAIYADVVQRVIDKTGHI